MATRESHRRRLRRRLYVEAVHAGAEDVSSWRRVSTSPLPAVERDKLRTGAGQAGNVSRR